LENYLNIYTQKAVGKGLNFGIQLFGFFAEGN